MTPLRHGWDEWSDAKTKGETVFEPEEPEWSGLLDAQGNRMVREREPIGFKIGSAGRRGAAIDMVAD